MFRLLLLIPTLFGLLRFGFRAFKTVKNRKTNGGIKQAAPDLLSDLVDVLAKRPKKK